MVYYYLFGVSHLSKLPFSGFLQFKDNFVRGQNNSKNRDWTPLKDIIFSVLTKNTEPPPQPEGTGFTNRLFLATRIPANWQHIVSATLVSSRLFTSQPGQLNKQASNGNMVSGNDRVKGSRSPLIFLSVICLFNNSKHVTEKQRKKMINPYWPRPCLRLEWHRLQ